MGEVATQNTWKVGDELAFSCNGRYMLHRVTAITPSGRLKCGPYTLNPDLTIRGKRSGYWSPYRGEPVTQKIRDSVRRMGLLNRVAATNPSEWQLLSVDALEAVCTMLSAAKQVAAAKEVKEDA